MESEDQSPAVPKQACRRITGSEGPRAQGDWPCGILSWRLNAPQSVWIAASTAGSFVQTTWVRITFELLGGNPGLYFTSSKEAKGGTGINLDAEAWNNGEIRRAVDMSRWNRIEVNLEGGSLKFHLNGLEAYSSFVSLPSSPEPVTVRPTMEERPQERWNAPTEYERWYASSLGRAYLSSLMTVLGPWRETQRTGTAADIGCGPGLVGKRLFPEGVVVVGIDCSAEMARRAALRAVDFGQPRHVVVGSVDALPFADKSFDMAVCINCLEFVDDRRRSFEEIARILRPRGVAILGVLHRQSLWELARRLQRPFSKNPYYSGRFFTEEDLESHLEAVGLEIQELRYAVHFPPGPRRLPGAAYELIRSVLCRLAPRGGGVILCRAARLS